MGAEYGETEGHESAEAEENVSALQNHCDISDLTSSLFRLEMVSLFIFITNDLVNLVKTTQLDVYSIQF